jgi:2-(1,2-epoxy-1,2-dihydrophenyl)acetyl-CoA isomerase
MSEALDRIEAQTEHGAMARRLADGPVSLGMIRQLYWEGLENAYPAQLDLEARMQSEAGLSTDHAEGITAFREKRPAQFKGR